MSLSRVRVGAVVAWAVLGVGIFPGNALAAHIRGAGQTVQEDPSVDFSKDFDDEVARDKGQKVPDPNAQRPRHQRRRIKTESTHDPDFDTPSPSEHKPDAATKSDQRTGSEEASKAPETRDAQASNPPRPKVIVINPEPESGGSK